MTRFFRLNFVIETSVADHWFRLFSFLTFLMYEVRKNLSATNTRSSPVSKIRLRTLEDVWTDGSQWAYARLILSPSQDYHI